MKAVIEKAIEEKAGLFSILERHIIRNEGRVDWKIVEVSVWEDGTLYIEYTSPHHDFHNELPSSFTISLHHLIFGTDLVDRVVGETRHCDLTKTSCTVKGCADYINSGIGPRVHLKYSNLADYHLHQMADPAISRDVEKLKEYLRSLI